MRKRLPIDHAELLRIMHYSPNTGIWRWRVKIADKVVVGGFAGTIAAVKKRYRMQVKIYGKRYRMHRLAWFYMTGEWPYPQVDHKDGNGLNNRWRNLRVATNGENSQNKTIQSNNTSGYVGVSWHKGHRKWRADIHIDRQQLTIGLFKTPEDAYNAYLAAKAELHTFQPTVRDQ